MAKYVYPAIFTEDEAGYSVRFPDVDGCFTSGRSLQEALEMAEDAMCLMLYDMEESGEAIPAASGVNNVQTEPGEFVSLIGCDTLAYRKRYGSKAVKKTLSIPSWLNEAAEKAGVNFSNVLQDALKQLLHLG